MNYKVFMKIIFEKTKYFLLYSLMMTTFWYILFIDVADAMFASHYEKRTPDIEITGKTAENDNILYQSLPLLSLDILKSSSVLVYGLSVREHYAFSDDDYQILYRIYGADYEFIDELEGYLKKGKLPKAGKKEAVIGSGLAKYLNVGVGDVFNISAPQNINASKEYEYAVAGILSNDMSFYSDGIYILRDTLPKEYKDKADNAFYIYTKNNTSYNELVKQLDSLDKNDIGNILLHRENKAFLFDTIIKSLVKTIPLSAVFLSALFISLMKYTGRKIGLMKALGLSDYNIMSIMIKGFGVFNLCGILNSFVAIGFIRLASDGSFSISVLLYTVCSYAIIFAVTLLIVFIICKFISPRKAMYQY